MAEIRRRVVDLTARQSKCLTGSLLPELARAGVVLASYHGLNTDERQHLDKYFDEQIMPILTPQAVDPTHPFPYISGGSLNIGLYIKPVLTKRVARAFAK